MPNHSMTPNEIKGAVYGLLIGDALGVPFEFKERSEIPEKISFELPEGYARSHAFAPERAWSDDGAQALCLLKSLLEKGFLDLEDFASKLIAWKNGGYMSVEGKVFDIGMGTREALERAEDGVPVLEAGAGDERSNGNGSLMRVLPLVLWHNGSDKELADLAMQQSRITHSHPISKISCAIYSLWARKISEGAENPFFSAVRAFESSFGEGSDEVVALDRYIKPRAHPEVLSGRGYVLDSLNIARTVMSGASSYESAVNSAICYGGDTDTNAAIVGGLAGLKFGYDNIPKHFAHGLRGREICDPIVDELIARNFGRAR